MYGMKPKGSKKPMPMKKEPMKKGSKKPIKKGM